MTTVEQERLLIRKRREMVDKIRNGETPLCEKCKKGVMKAIGNPKTTNSFHCTNCNNQLILN